MSRISSKNCMMAKTCQRLTFFLDRFRRCKAFNKNGSSAKDKWVDLIAAAGGSGNGTASALVEMESWCRQVGAVPQERIGITRYNRAPMLKQSVTRGPNSCVANTSKDFRDAEGNQKSGDTLGAGKMNCHNNLRLREPEVTPTSEVLELVLGDSYSVYETFQNALPGLEIEQEWQWYTPHKAWFAKGQHFWTTPRGTKREKNLFWLHVYDGFFSVAVWFKERNRMEVLCAEVSEETKCLIRNAETIGKVPTFPVVFDITTTEPLADICTLIDCKKKIEK